MRDASQPSPFVAQPLLVCSLIEAYLRKFPGTQGSKRRHLEFLKRHPFGAIDARALQTQDLVGHIQTRRSEGISAATAATELTWIGIVLEETKSAGVLPISSGIIKKARQLCREQQLIATRVSRRRNPTPEELQALDEYFAKHKGKATIPMRDIIRLAALTNLRAAEICRLEWTHTTARSSLLSHGSNRYVRLNAAAWAIVNRQPRKVKRVFPYKAKSICAAFANACNVLRIANVSFDDLRQRRSPARGM